MSEENTHKKEVSQEKLDAMRLGRLNGALKKVVHGFIEEYKQREKDIDETLEIVTAQVEKYFEGYEDDLEEKRILEELREKFGDKFTIKSKKSTLA